MVIYLAIRLNKMSISTLEQVIKAFSDRNRLRIIKLLEHRKLCVCEIAYVLSIKEASVSRHMKKMKAAGIVESSKDGHWVHYYIDPKNRYAEELLQKVREYLNDDKTVKEDGEKVKEAKKELICRF